MTNDIAPPAPAPAPEAPTAGTGVVAALARHGGRPALLSTTAELSYGDLARRVAVAAARFGGGRRLVLLGVTSTVESLVAYLGALEGGHPVLVVRDDDATVEAMVSAYDPDVVVRAGRVVEERRSGTAHDLHPELALLLSTSGSTGSPKLVRLSLRNLHANARSIAEYLALRPGDRAVTTLPLQYCYGLSVVHSHLLTGASVVLTDLSVVDPCFWDLVRRHRVTSLAGVPHTFALLDRVGFADMDLPHLRYVTQAGGRMEPARVRRFAELGRRRGWDLFVMYGQTEATARMAYLPPDRALTSPQCIGVPVPGGELVLEPVEGADDGVGELVYSGPNVMLGYAEGPADLGLGRTVDRLRTGDLARRTGDGLLVVVGRRSRFAKVLGLRIDLDRVESALADAGWTSSCADVEGDVAVVVEGVPDVAAVRRAVSASCGVPSASVRVVGVPELPRLASGKPDLVAVREIAARPGRPGTATPAQDLPGLFAEVLDRDDVTPDSTFVGLGGDSLSYVELSVRLEEQLGHLPAGWHVTPIGDLVPRAPTDRRRRHRDVDTSVVLRALAILAIVSGHAGLLGLRGGAHVLIAVAGYNLARFTLTDAPVRRRTAAIGSTLGRIVAPSVAWIGGAALVTGVYGLENVLLVHAFLGPDQHGPTWAYWFVETLVWTVVAVTALLHLPGVDRARRTAPFAFASALVGIGLLFRYSVLEIDTGPDRIHTPHLVFWLFALGWAASVATRTWQRVAVCVVLLVAVPGYFVQDVRLYVLLAGLGLLVWCRTLPVPAALVRPTSTLAAASLFIYVSHFQVYPLLASPALGVVASLAVGLAYWRLWSATTDQLSRLRRRREGGRPRTAVAAARTAGSAGSGLRATSTTRHPREPAIARSSRSGLTATAVPTDSRNGRSLTESL
jgi:acyl-CoA synthetase (AMP-forming)/AMP-acid ligase II